MVNQLIFQNFFHMKRGSGHAFRKKLSQQRMISCNVFKQMPV